MGDGPSVRRKERFVKKETNELHPDHLNWEAYMG